MDIKAKEYGGVLRLKPNSVPKWMHRKEKEQQVSSASILQEIVEHHATGENIMGKYGSTKL